MRIFKTPESTITIALNNGNASLLASSFYDAAIMVRPDVAIGNRVYFRFLKSDDDVRSNLTEVISLSEFKRPKSKFQLAICCGPSLLAVYNVKTQSTDSIVLSDLAENYSTFLPITGQQAVVIDANTAADVKACQQITRLLDTLARNNHIEQDHTHSINEFIRRVLFCLFAEDLLYGRVPQLTCGLLY